MPLVQDQGARLRRHRGRRLQTEFVERRCALAVFRAQDRFRSPREVDRVGLGPPRPRRPDRGRIRSATASPRTVSAPVSGPADARSVSTTILRASRRAAAIAAVKALSVGCVPPGVPDGDVPGAAGCVGAGERVIDSQYSWTLTRAMALDSCAARSSETRRMPRPCRPIPISWSWRVGSRNTREPSARRQRSSCR